VDAPFQARENVGVVVARGRMLSSVRPLMRQEESRRPVWEFADRIQITQSVLEALWKALVVPAPSRRLLRHTLLPLARWADAPGAALLAVRAYLPHPPRQPRLSRHIGGEDRGETPVWLMSLRRPPAAGRKGKARDALGSDTALRAPLRQA
jgi:hypothetical protein